MPYLPYNHWLQLMLNRGRFSALDNPALRLLPDRPVPAPLGWPVERKLPYVMPSPTGRKGAAQLTPAPAPPYPFGLLSPDLWLHSKGNTLAEMLLHSPEDDDPYEEPGQIELQRPADIGAMPGDWDRHPRRSGDPSVAPLASATQETDNRLSEDEFLPDAVVNSFRETLDDEGSGFLKYGPRTPTEQLAFAQGIRPDAHLSASPAPDAVQARFRERGHFDTARYFVGPGDRLYVRGEGTVEPLAHRLRRGMERAVGFRQPNVATLLAGRQLVQPGHAKAFEDEQLASSETTVSSPSKAMRGATAREIHKKENRWPLLIREPERRKSILENTAGQFDIADDPDADWSTPWYSVHADGYRGVKRHDSRIEREAKRIGVDPDLVRAIMYVEYANGYSYGGPAQFAGLAGSLYPMNIKPEIWQGLMGDNADFNDSDVNVRAGALLLERIANRVSHPSIAKIATLYNSLAKDEVSNYGAQVARAYRDKVWTVPTLP